MLFALITFNCLFQSSLSTSTSYEKSVWSIQNRPLPQSLSAAQMAYNNKTSNIYIFGGYTTSELSYSNAVYKRNMSNQSNPWIKLNITTPGNVFLSQIQNAVTINETVYFIGINNGSFSSNQIFLFNLSSEQFIPNNISLLPYSACCGCLVTNNTHIFMFGGVSAEVLINYIQILDIKLNTWTHKTIDLPFISTGWAAQICSMINNALYIFGGVIQHPLGKSTNVIYKYDVLSSKWHFLSNLSHWASQAWAVYSTKYDKIYVTTVEKEVGNVSLSVFDVKKEKIVCKSELMLALWQTPMLLCNDVITIFGGYGYYFGTTISQIIQSVKLPLIEHKQSSSKKTMNMSTGLFVGIILINSIVCILIGCVVGYISYRYFTNRGVRLLSPPQRVM